MSPRWKRLSILLFEVIYLFSTLAVGALPVPATNSAPTGEEALLLMIAVYARFEISSGAALLPAAPGQPRLAGGILLRGAGQTVQDQINENKALADLYWLYFENARDDKSKEHFAAQAQKYQDAADALDKKRDGRRRRPPGIARFFHGVGRVINKVVGGIVVGGAKATEFIVDEALPMYIQLMIKTLPDKHINLMWDKIAARLGGGPAGEFLAKKIRKFIEPYFLRMRDHLFNRRLPEAKPTEMEEAPGGEIVNAEGAFLEVSGDAFLENEIYLHFNPEGGPVTGKGRNVQINSPGADDELIQYLDMEFTGTYTAETKSFAGVIQVKSYYKCAGDCSAFPPFNYPANWNGILEGKIITGWMDGQGDFELVVK
jgi:hypothetical protein